MKLEELKRYSDQLSKLLEDPQPGLMSWNMHLNEVLRKICTGYLGLPKTGDIPNLVPDARGEKLC